jgi:type I restriction enzyme S subunit
MSWEIVKLCEIASSQYGFTASSTTEPIGPRFLRITDIVPSSISWDVVPFCVADEATRKKYLLRKGDIVVARTGATTGYAKLIRSDVDAIFASYLVRFQIIDERANPDFVGRILESHVYKAYVDGVKGGAAQPNANAVSLGNFEFKLPPLPTQQRIAGMLSAYDDLIENNRRRISLLEQAARLLYREWFVNLRFPGHETAKIVDGLPEGWSRATIKEISSFISRGITPTYDEDAPGYVINQKCIRENRVSLLPARRQSKRVPHEKLIQKFDVLVNSTGAGTLGRVAQCFIEHPNLTVDSHVTILRPSFGLDALWFGQTVVDREGLIETLGRGATNQTELGKDDLGRVDVTVPPEGIRDQYGATVGPMLFQSQLLSDNIVKLTRARDLLLPRLMDGRIPV